MNKVWVRRRWFDFRQGHSVYLIFALTFANFVLIFHRLLIERVPILNEIFSSLLFFALFFVIIYIPLAVGIGAWHRRTQLRVDTEVNLRQNPLMARYIGFLIDLQIGKVSKEDIENMRRMLKKIETGKNDEFFSEQNKK